MNVDLINSAIELVRVVNRDAVSGLLSIECQRCADLLAREVRSYKERDALEQLNMGLEKLKGKNHE